MNKHSMSFVGLDLGDKLSYITIVDPEGELIEESRLPTTEPSFRREFSTLQPCRAAVEVRTHSRWASHLFKDLGHDVLVANARKLPAIYHNPRKGDRADAETLVRCRTSLINHTRDLVKASSSRLPSCSADSFARKVAAGIPEPLRPALAPILDTIASLTQQIQSYDQANEELCRHRYPETQLLRITSGVGPLTSLAFILTLENPARLHRSREVGPALGLVPAGINPAIKIPSSASPKPVMPTCAACSLDQLSTSWDLSDLTAICGAGG